jgi:flagellar biosynthesis/type III secretory pathway M-ring protein FliF/YscJ
MTLSLASLLLIKVLFFAMVLFVAVRPLITHYQTYKTVKQVAAQGGYQLRSSPTPLPRDWLSYMPAAIVLTLFALSPFSQ